LQDYPDVPAFDTTFVATITPKPDPLTPNSLYVITEPTPDLTTESVAEEQVEEEDGN
jgi:hypothetical protein